MGRTAHFAASRGYYKLGKTYNSLPHFAHLMYAGALYHLVAGSFFLLCSIALTISTFMDRGSDIRVNIFFIHLVLLWSLIFVWMGSWIFWGGFVNLAGNL